MSPSFPRKRRWNWLPKCDKANEVFETASSEQICAWSFPLPKDTREEGCRSLRSLGRGIGD
jgi:hypothetical protein